MCASVRRPRGFAERAPAGPTGDRRAGCFVFPSVADGCGAMSLLGQAGDTQAPSTSAASAQAGRGEAGVFLTWCFLF